MWADGVTGELAGASDTHFVTAEYLEEFAAPMKVRVVRYDAGARTKKLAEFRADGLAGQVRAIGNRAAWVNPDREVVLAPLAGGDRTAFKPF